VGAKKWDFKACRARVISITQTAEQQSLINPPRVDESNGGGDMSGGGGGGDGDVIGGRPSDVAVEMVTVGKETRELLRVSSDVSEATAAPL
jgi:hypothetical protein